MIVLQPFYFKCFVRRDWVFTLFFAVNFIVDHSCVYKPRMISKLIMHLILLALLNEDLNAASRGTLFVRSPHCCHEYLTVTSRFTTSAREASECFNKSC